MFIATLTLIIGLCILVFSAQKLVHHAITLGQYHHLSELMIGITIIGIGTSLPEIMVSILAAFKGSPDLALGNGYGSNIANILFILGASLLICPIRISKTLWQGELSYLCLVSIITLGFLMTGMLGRTYGLMALVLYGWIIFKSLKQPNNQKKPKQVKLATPYATAWLFVVLSFIALMASAQMLVSSATFIAQQLNVGDEIIGLTVVAIGTSLPELATSLAACQQKKPDLILGNVIGSNLLNTMVVIGVAALIHPITVHSAIIYRDFSLMLTATLYLWVRCYTQKPTSFTRLEGILFLLSYVAFLTLLANHIISQN